MMKLKGKTVLYIGPIKEGTITFQRMLDMKELGAIIIQFNTLDYSNRLRNRISRRLAYKFNFGSVVRKLNKNVRQFSFINDYDLVWINKGILFNENTIKVLKNNSNLNVIVHYTADPAVYSYLNRYFRKAISSYDYIVTTKSYEIELYKKYGCKNLIFVQQGYDERLYNYSDSININKIYDVVFIGRCEPYYIEVIKEIEKITKNIAIWGPWGKAVKKHPFLNKYWKHKSVFDEEYMTKLKEGKIVLGLLCKIHPDQTTTRTFEIPASGSFLLAERTEEHESLFEDEKEAIFFNSLEDLKHKVKYYLENNFERESIAKNGHEKIKNANYSNKNRILEIFHKIAEV